jgi:hypothetical protein
MEDKTGTNPAKESSLSWRTPPLFGLMIAFDDRKQALYAKVHPHPFIG